MSQSRTSLYANVPEYCQSVKILKKDKVHPEDITIEDKDFSLAPSKYIEFIDHDLDIDYAKEMARIQSEMRLLMTSEELSQSMLKDAFRGIGYQRCIVHFYRNVFTVTPRGRMKDVTRMLKAIHAQETREAAREKAQAVVQKLREMRLKEAAKKVEDGIEETLTYCDFPSEHWTRIRTNNVIERLNREIRRRTRVVGTFPDGNSALMLVCARLRHVAGTQWGNKKYMNMKHLEAVMDDASIAG